MTREEMKARTKKYALRVIKAVQALPNDRVAQVLSTQFLRAGTSVGANYRAACRAKSTTDFVNKLEIVEEEGDESLFGMELRVESGITPQQKLGELMKEGDEIDLGGRGFRAVEPVVRDMRTTWWGFETRERVLFPGDGFAYSHYHEDGHCGLVAEEAVSLDLQDTTAVFADLALWWTKWADMRHYCDRLDHLMNELGVKTGCPTHGLVITDVARTMPKVKEGLLYGSTVAERGTNDAGFGKKVFPAA